MRAIDRQASYTAYNPTALTSTVQTFRKRRAGLSATAGLSCNNSFTVPLRGELQKKKE